MSLQDDYFDVRDTLKGKPEAEQFENIWKVFCREEEELLKLREALEEIRATLKQTGIANSAVSHVAPQIQREAESLYTAEECGDDSYCRCGCCYYCRHVKSQ